MEAALHAPLLSLPRVSFVPFLCSAFRIPIRPRLSASPRSLSLSKGEAGRRQCLSLLTSSLLSPCCHCTTVISSILLITNTFSSPPPSTASQVNTALGTCDVLTFLERVRIAKGKICSRHVIISLVNIFISVKLTQKLPIFRNNACFPLFYSNAAFKNCRPVCFV